MKIETARMSIVASQIRGKRHKSMKRFPAVAPSWCSS